MDLHRPEKNDDRTVVLSILGMTCSGCANTVTRVLSRVPGVSSAKVDLTTGRAVVTGEARSEELVAAVQAAGYGAQLAASDTTDGGRNERGRRRCC